MKPHTMQRLRKFWLSVQIQLRFNEVPGVFTADPSRIRGFDGYVVLDDFCTDGHDFRRMHKRHGLPLEARTTRRAIVLMQRERAYRTRKIHNRTSRRLISVMQIGRTRWVLRPKGDE